MCQKGDSHTHKHTEATAHSIGGQLQRLDTEREDVRGLQQAENTEKTTTGRLLGASGCFLVCGRTAVTTAI